MSENSNGGTIIGDFLGAGKGIDKLTELISNVFGKFTNSYFIRRDAAAKADELRLLGQAEAEVYERKALAEANRMRIISEGIRDAAPGTGGITVMPEGSTIKSLPAGAEDSLPAISIKELAERANKRELYQKIQRQQNIESITAIAAEQLKGDPDVSDEKVDPDLITQFFKYVEDISNEEMQTIWGKILAGEVKKPNTFTVRMLDTIKKLTQEEAQLFSSLSNRVLLTPYQGFIFKFSEGYDVPKHQEQKLVEAGLVLAGESLIYSTENPSDQPVTHSLETQNHYMQFSSPPHSKYVGTPIVALTSTGIQLAKFINAEDDVVYLKNVAEAIRNSDRIVRFGKIISRNDNGRVHLFQMFPEWQGEN